jgi:hypothetical protein
MYTANAPARGASLKDTKGLQMSLLQELLHQHHVEYMMEACVRRQGNVRLSMVSVMCCEFSYCVHFDVLRRTQISFMTHLNIHLCTHEYALAILRIRSAYSCLLAYSA